MLVFPENNPKKFYSGIGSRATPPTTQRIMMYFARELERDGYTLRSGNATGADQAFAKGVVKNAQIWLPWKDFEKDFQEKHPDHRYRLVGDYCTCGEPDDEAWDSVEKFHPNFNNMHKLVGTPTEKKYYTFLKFMARNYRQIRGLGDEPDSQFVVCWTPKGEEVGGTAQAIRIARHFDIPVYNLFNMTKEDVSKEIHKLNLLQ